MPIPPLLRAEAISHPREGPAGLRDVSLAIEAGRFTLLSGGVESGAGLLLRILGLLDRPDEGEVWFDAQATAALDEGDRLALRNRHVGFLFAEPFLLDSFSVAENVAMPLFRISGFTIEQAQERTTEVLGLTGLGAEGDFTVADLSPLERHKLSLARALAIGPRVMIAEDAGIQLSAVDRRKFALLVRGIPDSFGISVIATSPEGAEMFSPDREIRLENGIVVSDSQPAAAHEAPSRD